ncbi:FAD-linked oxidase-like protein [Gorgonomyces haynaldii]|nr:FAD-linked oxidase-like protein [Gorgonomyces haynaldii]
MQSLKQRFRDQFKTDSKTRERKSSTHSYHPTELPLGVVECQNEQDIVDCLKICQSHKIPVITVSGQSSIEGQLSCTKESIMIDTSQMDKIVKINKDDLDCVVEPGVNWVHLNHVLESHGLFFPPDPGSQAMIGGMCGTNCSGTLAWKYGPMKENVVSMRCVLPDGRVIQTKRRPRKSSAGYDLARLFIGSEGTLAVTSQIVLKLRPIPQKKRVILAQFETLESAGQLVIQVVQSGLPLERMELMDDRMIVALNLYHELDPPLQEKTTLLFELGAMSDIILDEQAKALSKLAHAQKCVLFKEGKGQQAQKLWQLRKGAYFASKALAPDDALIMTTDIAVPISKLAEMLRASRQELDRLKIPSTILAHAGDGNIHCMLMLDTQDPQQLKSAYYFRDTNTKLAIELGGTCTGEHGVGTGKRDLLELELGSDAIDLMREIKQCLDPNGIMNPGKIFKPKL